MSRELWPFYDRELRAFEAQARDFAKAYPKEATHLALGPTGRSTDPHVERLVQAFALLAARVHQKLDDDFPELTDALLNLLYPHYLAPLPSLVVAALDPTPGADLTQGLLVPRHTPFRSTPFAGTQFAECEYRTTYPVRLWPLAVTAATLKGPPYTDFRELLPTLGVPPNGAKARLVLRLAVPAGTPLEAVAVGTPGPDGVPLPVRFFLDADGPLTATLYELLFNGVSAVVFREPGELNAVLVPPADAVLPVGFGCGTDGRPDEGVLPYPDHAFPGYRLLTEFFAYRDKFWFFDLAGWDVARRAGVLKKSAVEVHFFLTETVTPEQEQAVRGATFRLGCVPLVNLFVKRSTEAIDLTHRRYDYPLVPDRDRPDAHEVFSVDAVYSRKPTGEEERYEAFYSFRHQTPDHARRYWYAKRAAAGRPDDRGTDLTVHFVDCDFDPRAPAESLALAAVTCCNRDLPLKLRDTPDAWELRPVGLALPAAVTVVRPPTPTLRPTQHRGDAAGRPADAGRKMTYWRVVSHLALNHLSLTDKTRGREALTEYLALYDFSDATTSELGGVARQVREGVLSVDSRRDVAFVPGDAAGGYARGVEVLLELDEDKFVGTGAYLFAAVLDRFFGLAVTINSFTRLTHLTRQRGVIKNWPPRAGEKPLV